MLLCTGSSHQNSSDLKMPICDLSNLQMQLILARWTSRYYGLTSFKSCYEISTLGIAEFQTLS